MRTELKIRKNIGTGKLAVDEDGNKSLLFTKPTDEFPVVVLGGEKVQGQPHFYVFVNADNRNKKPKIQGFQEIRKLSGIEICILDLRIIEVVRVTGIKKDDVRWENFPKAKEFLKHWLWKKSSFNNRWTNLEYICFNWNVMNVGTFGGVKRGFKFWKTGNKLPTEIPLDYIPVPRKLRHQFDIDFEDGLWDFTNIFPSDTAFKKMVFLTHKREHRKTPFLLVKAKDDYVPVTIEEKPKIRFKKKVRIPGFRHLQDWILKKKSVLLNYWIEGAEPYRMNSANLIEALDPTWKRK